MGSECSAVGFSVEQLQVELEWIDEHIGDKPYGVDIVLPAKYDGVGEMDLDKLTGQLQEMIPQGHRDFVHQLIEDHGADGAAGGRGAGQRPHGVERRRPRSRRWRRSCVIPTW
ncbi:MAG: hypothetical protein R2695_16160 [Acidimicrobiales bacterium]